MSKNSDVNIESNSSDVRPRLGRKSILALGIALGVFAASHSGAEEVGVATDKNSGTADYAEGVYRDVSRFSAGRVSFKTLTVEIGRLSDIPGARIGDFISAPAYDLLFDFEAENLLNARFVPGVSNKEKLAVYSLPLATVEKKGLTADLGIYRKLQVAASLDGESHTYTAVEFCWPSLNRCELVDGANLTLDSVIRDSRRIELQEPDDGAEYLSTDSNPAPEAVGKADPIEAVCVSNLNGKRSYEVPQNGTVKEGKVLGLRVWKITTGKVVAKLRCDRVTGGNGGNCKMTVSATASGSIATAASSRKTSCDADHVTPESGNKGKYDVLTGCSVGSPGGEASFKINAEGSGLEASLKIESRDSVQVFNRIRGTDTCVIDFQ
ncbi:MAG: hypothetical protein MUE46_19800 [Xanthomonadales bacterium]|nr:hypothetical protein [Xanthomonadales bacterium]